jgi:hypothetical protein
MDGSVDDGSLVDDGSSVDVPWVRHGHERRGEQGIDTLEAVQSSGKSPPCIGMCLWRGKGGSTGSI